MCLYWLNLSFCQARDFLQFHTTQINLSFKTAYLCTFSLWLYFAPYKCILLLFSAQKAQILWRALRAFFTFAPWKISPPPFAPPNSGAGAPLCGTINYQYNCQDNGCLGWSCIPMGCEFSFSVCIQAYTVYSISYRWHATFSEILNII